MSITLAARRSSLGPSGLLFLFAKGQRPTRRDMLAQIKAVDRSFVSHDPVELTGPEAYEQSGAGEASHWLELLRDGLTFDLLGLGDGPSLAVPPIDQRIGCAADLSPDDVEAMGLFPGPHLAEGAASLPIVRTQLALAADLIGGLPGLLAMFWTPGAVATGPSLFAQLVREWLDGGAFPALGLVNLELVAPGALRSRGLRFFVGQEMELSTELSQDRIAATRLAVRIINELIVLGAIESDLELEIGREGLLRLLPSGGGTLVLVDRA